MARQGNTQWVKAARQDEIVRLLLMRGTVSIPELARHLDVSGVTVRRDLNDLRQIQRLERVRGGAQALQPSVPEPPVVRRQNESPAEKKAIGRAAGELVKDGDTVAITTGSTTLELARTIAMREWRCLRVVTNSFPVAGELMRTPGVELIFVGGRVTSGELGTFGVLAEDMLKRLNIGKLFMGTRGIDLAAGISNDEQSEISSDRSFMAAARRVILLADHSKFGKAYTITIQPISSIGTLVTDDLVPSPIVDGLRQYGIQVLVATTTPQ